MLEVTDLELAYDDKTILRVEHLRLEQAEIACIIGPSGSGKSTFLRSLCGLLTPVRGEIRLDDDFVFSAQLNTPASARNVGMVFQDLCLFPHMNVAQNIAYGLHQLESTAREERVSELLALTNLEAFAERYPFELSGGQQQRVAIARAVAPRPAVLLMDEPFSSLDPNLREQLAHDLRKMLKALDITTLIVTHDQLEAFALGDKLALFDIGQCLQVGSPYELYHQPKNTHVAQFIGESALISGKIKSNDGEPIVSTVIGELAFSETPHMTFHEAEEVQVLIRPDDLVHDDKSALQAKVIDRHFRGSHIMFKLKIAEQELSCLAPSHHNHTIGESFGFCVELEHLIVFKKMPYCP